MITRRTLFWFALALCPWAPARGKGMTRKDVQGALDIVTKAILNGPYLSAEDDYRLLGFNRAMVSRENWMQAYNLCRANDSPTARNNVTA